MQSFNTLLEYQLMELYLPYDVIKRLQFMFLTALFKCYHKSEHIQTQVNSSLGQ